MLSRIRGILKRRGYELKTRAYELNIVGLRSKSTKANKFDDEFHVFYKTDKNKWHYHLYKGTTDPGTYWLKNPSYPQGTAILQEGQYKDAYAIGLHQGKYKALVQVKPVTVIRDYDRDAFLDFNTGTMQKGMFGINIHRADGKGKTKSIDKYSAGCQVFEDAESYSEFMDLAEQHRKLYGNSFTYTLIDFRAVRRITLKRIAATASIIAGLVIGFFFQQPEKPKSKNKRRK